MANTMTGIEITLSIIFFINIILMILNLAYIKKTIKQNTKILEELEIGNEDIRNILCNINDK